MDTLPPEILLLLLQHVDYPSLLSLRLVSETFNTLTFPLIFSHIPFWLDYKKSHQAILSSTHNLCNIPAVVWSPWASEPDEDVCDVWLGICWRVLTKRDGLPGMMVVGVEENGKEGGIEGREVLMKENFGRLSGLGDDMGKKLRVGRNRFLLHRQYSEKRRVEALCIVDGKSADLENCWAFW